MPRCKYHKEKFEAKYFNQKYCLKDDECIKAFNEYVKLEKQKQKKQQDKIQKKELREKLTNWKKKLQDEVQLIARLIDKDLTCLARGKYGKMAGGHIYSKGGHSQMRFNLHNIHRQSFASNNCQNDDGLLREQLEIEYGTEYFEFVKSLRSYDVPKLSDAEYQQAYNCALKATKELKKDDKAYSLKERIALRNELNLKIGVYSETQSVFNGKKNQH